MKPDAMLTDIMILPSTTPRRYMSGVAALNLPLSDFTGDWHFTTVFAANSLQRPRCFIVGENCIVNTLPLIGELGIIECSEILKSRKIIFEGSHYYSATHARAIADLVIAAVVAGDSPEHVVLDDWMPRDCDKQEVFSLLAVALPLLTVYQCEIARGWISKNQGDI